MSSATVPAIRPGMAFACGPWTCSLDQVILAADFRGEMLPYWQGWTKKLPSIQKELMLGREPEESELQDLIDGFRYDRRLTAAEECEEWLAQRELTTTDLRNSFVRSYWGSHSSPASQSPFPNALPAPELLTWFRTDLLLSGYFDSMARRLAWRVAAGREERETEKGRDGERENGRQQAVTLEWAPGSEATTVFKPDPEWIARLESLEEAYAKESGKVLTPENRRRMANTLRLNLLRVELEVLGFESERAARETLAGIRYKGITFKQAAEGTTARLRKISSLVEDLPERWRQPVVSAPFGKVVGPLASEDGFSILKVEAKHEPQLDREDVRKHVDEALLYQHFMELEGRHIRWHIDVQALSSNPLSSPEGLTSRSGPLGRIEVRRPRSEVRSEKAVAQAPASHSVFDGIDPQDRGRIRRFPFVWQIDEMDCGVACLAMVSRHFGREVSVARLRRLCYTGGDGTSLQDICEAATEIGLAARPLKISKRHLDYAPLPAIAHWEGNHWLVVIAVSEDSVKVADPAYGIRKIPRQDFLDKWTGYAALFDYAAGFQPTPEKRRSLAWLRLFLAPFRTALLQSLGLAALVSVLQLLFPILTQQVVDSVMVDRDLDLLNLLMLVMGFAIGFLLLATLTQQYLLSYITLRLDTSVLDFLTRRLLALPMSYFHRRRTGDIQRRLDAARQIRQFMVQRGLGGVLAVIQLIGCLALMGLYSPLLLGVFLLVMPLYAGLMLFSFKVLRPLFAQIEETQARYNSHQIDAIRGIEAVKAAAAELTFRDKMLREFLAVSRKVFRSNFITMAYEGALQAVSLAATALFLLAGARMVIAGSLSIGAFVAFSSLMAMASAAIMQTLGLWDELQLMSVLVNRLNDLFEQEPEQGTDRSHLVPVRSLSGKIELRNVSFRYGGPDSPEVVRNISLEIPAGRALAVVGRSGSGKTTLVKLLAGLIEPTSGDILYDGQQLKKLNYRELRQHVGIVLQENHLFDDTILNNIAFGDLNPDGDQVVRAATMANAHDFITDLPLGYETRVGETGLGLSSGQKQRVAIARALYNDPAVLIFDEATSALDSESERAVQANMRRLMSGRTCIVIAHRLSTVRDADQIVVLEHGEIVERGTHQELVDLRGLYHHLCAQQIAV